MKVAGLLVMPAGLFLVLAALVLFADPTRRGAFVVCGIVVQALGLAVSIRGHVRERRAERP